MDNDLELDYPSDIPDSYIDHLSELEDSDSFDINEDLSDQEVFDSFDDLDDEPIFLSMESIDYSEKLEFINSQLSVMNVILLVIAAIVFLTVVVNAIKKALCLDFI